MKRGWVETGSLVERSYLRSACREEGPGSDTWRHENRAIPPERSIFGSSGAGRVKVWRVKVVHLTS
jgi:hypothetical protein